MISGGEFAPFIIVYSLFIIVENKKLAVERSGDISVRPRDLHLEIYSGAGKATAFSQNHTTVLIPKDGSSPISQNLWPISAIEPFQMKHNPSNAG